MNYLTNRRKFCVMALLVLVLICAYLQICTCFLANAFPFYDLQPQDLVLRSRFYTSYTTSTEERKSNVKLAAKALNNVLVDVGSEFSFNRTVGPRTEKNGYKTAKIIVNGEFVDGVGGGVCQVSTTLYNAVLLAGLNVIEYHPHSLPVSYIAPSFDAMVNSGSADLKFINDTHNPIIIKTHADDSTIVIEIYGEPSPYKFSRQSVLNAEIPAPKEDEVFDEKNEYPNLYEGEKLVVRYSKSGIKSEGYLIKYKDGKAISVTKIRTDKYAATKGLIIHGKAIRPVPPSPETDESDIGNITVPLPELTA